MARVNYPRVVGGGLAAGLIMTISQFILNEPVLGEASARAFGGLNLLPPGGATIAFFIVTTFAVGIAMIWTYAVFRSHFGPGPKTAVCVGLLVWFLYYCLGNIKFAVMGMMPVSLILTALIWGLVEVPLAAVAGAYLYKE